MAGLSNAEILKIVNRYIGVFDGYLGNFSYRTHADFYPEYCDLDINPNQIEGTTRERFIEILKSSQPNVQAKIVRGVLERFPLSAEIAKPATRTQELRNELVEIAKRLESSNYTFNAKKNLKVFLCHSSSDKPVVEKYYGRLINDGVDAWLDKKNLIPGQNWQLEIPKAVKNSDIVIVFLSSSSITKEGFVQKEIRIALDTADEKPDGTIFIIPARLENCEVPERLKKFQWVDLFEKDGYERVLKALQMRSHSLGIVINSKNHEELETRQRRKEEEASKYHPFETEKIVAWDWGGVDIRKESQNIRAGGGKETDSIMFRVLSELQKDDYQVIFDDDGAGEAADIVTINISEKSDNRKNIMVEFYHCKYSSMNYPGLRLNELYEVCGQATKSALWMKSGFNQANLFSHLIDRDVKIIERQGSTRFERGSREDLLMIQKKLRTYSVQFKVFIVLPGLSKKAVNDAALELLSSTENHLMNTCKSSLGVIASP